MNAPPRWWVGRAARLSASLVEAMLCAQGDAALRQRACEPAFWEQLAAALGCRDLAPERVARVLARGLAHRGDGPAAAAVLPPRPVMASPARALSVALSPAAADDRLNVALSAHRRASAQAPTLALPAALREPGLGARATLALSLLSELVFASPPPQLLSLALGDCSGHPFGVPLRVYDCVLLALEGWLLPPPRSAAAAWADARGGGGRGCGGLESLFLAARRLEPLPPAGDWTKFCASERRYAQDYASFSAKGPPVPGLSPPRLPRRRKSPPPEAAAAADLFLP